MLESLIFMFLIFVGGIFLITSLITLVIGIIKRSTKIKQIGIGIGLVPILCFGLIAFWYSIAIPSFNQNQMEDFSGTYIPHHSSQGLINKKGMNGLEPNLILNSDGTYLFDSIPGIRIEKKGTWKTGGIDGAFEFHNERGSLSGRADPSGSGKDSALSFDFRLDKKDWKSTKRILFIKKQIEL